MPHPPYYVAFVVKDSVPNHCPSPSRKATMSAEEFAMQSNSTAKKSSLGNPSYSLNILILQDYQQGWGLEGRGQGLVILTRPRTDSVISLHAYAPIPMLLDADNVFFIHRFSP
jgi:hypothetical protein